MRLSGLSYLLPAILLSLSAAAQTGIWLPSQPTENGLGGWWELRTDGSATYDWGAFAEAHYTFDGTVLTVIPGGARKDRPRFYLRWEGDSMYSRADQKDAPEAIYRRIGVADHSSTASGTVLERLIGQWASVPASKVSTPDTPQMADMPGMTGPPHDMPSIRTFTAGGIYQVRIVYNSRQGRWDPSHRTITLDGEPVQQFSLKNGTLTIDGAAYRPN
jgi:hypothetical protein